MSVILILYGISARDTSPDGGLPQYLMRLTDPYLNGSNRVFRFCGISRAASKRILGCMYDALRRFAGFVALSVFVPNLAAPAAMGASESRRAVVDGLELHYLTAGSGPAVILLHGYTQTSRMWRRVIPMLA